MALPLLQWHHDGVWKGIGIFAVVRCWKMSLVNVDTGLSMAVKPTLLVLGGLGPRDSADALHAAD